MIFRYSLALASRQLFVVASEVDDRGDKIRSAITIYKLKEDKPTYPTIVSADRRDGLPIPWGALSALAADPDAPHVLYTAYDSFYKKSRIFAVDVSQFPALITDEIVLHDANGETVDLDVEGVAVSSHGGFWVVSEGAGSVDDEARPVTSHNLLLQVAFNGLIEKTINLPDATEALQRRFGFEGVAESITEQGKFVYIAFQREWVDDPEGLVRIGRYDTKNAEWAFYHYPLDTPTSLNGGSWSSQGSSQGRSSQGQVLSRARRNGTRHDLTPFFVPFFRVLRVCGGTFY